MGPGHRTGSTLRRKLCGIHTHCQRAESCHVFFLAPTATYQSHKFPCLRNRTLCHHCPSRSTCDVKRAIQSFTHKGISEFSEAQHATPTYVAECLQHCTEDDVPHGLSHNIFAPTAPKTSSSCPNQSPKSVTHRNEISEYKSLRAATSSELKTQSRISHSLTHSLTPCVPFLQIRKPRSMPEVTLKPLQSSIAARSAPAGPRRKP